MRTLVTILCAVVLIGGTQFINNLAPDAQITIRGVSPQMAHDEGLPAASTGLNVVGVGDLVYLEGAEASGETPVLYSWAISVAPVGSVITLDSTQSQTFTFRPDMEGTFTVELTITTNSGTAATAQDIVAATYVGVGVMGGATADFAGGQCGSCHASQAIDYMQTRHASKLTREMDGLGSSYYRESCIECHTVGFNEDEEAVNGGFDDVMEELGWTFPETLEDGNWQDLVDNYPHLAQLANIQCENCHGPGSLHKGNTANIDVTLEVGVCATCHGEETHHVRPMQWANSKHATGSSFSYAGGRSSCAGCHSGYGYVARMDPASNLDQTTGAGGITCATCHDPHDASGEHQLRAAALDEVILGNGEEITFGGAGRLCMNCHKSRRDAEEYVTHNVSSHFGPHGGPETDMLAGRNAITFGRVLPNSTHMDVLEEACVTCHMQDEPGSDDPNYHLVGEHTWEMSANGVDHVAVCQSCHGAIDSFDDIIARKDHDGDGTIEAAQAEVHGLLDAVGMYLPPLGEPEFDIRDADNRAWYADKPWAKKVLYNYRLADEDGSGGVHNYQFTVALLQLTLEVAQYGVLTEGTIVGVTDVPNDQGKFVNVTWTRFGGDGASDAPLEVYYVWRNDGMAASKEEATYTTFEAVPTNAELESTVMFEGAMWTAVGSQPAAQMEFYSAVVPTLFDSTAAGVMLSEFKVTGHTAVSTVYVESDPATGYSIDNLAPAAPTAVVAMAGTGGIQLRWEDAVDADFNYFALYRGTTSGFAPDEAHATLTGTEFIDAEVDAEATYYYRLAAFDFSGNRGEFSPEVQASMATSIAVGGEVPTDYNLFQNYPNPFNPTTQIEYAVPEAGNVRIVIYDISGKEVTVLVDEYVSAGRYVAPWSANNLASGVYFYRMDAGSYTRTQTMLLIK